MDFERNIWKYGLCLILYLIKVSSDYLYAQSDFKESLSIYHQSELNNNRTESTFKLIDIKDLPQWESTQIIRRVGADRAIVKVGRNQPDRVESNINEVSVNGFEWKCSSKLLQSLNNRKGGQLSIQLKILDKNHFQRLCEEFDHDISHSVVQGDYAKLILKKSIIEKIIDSESVSFADLSEKKPFVETRINYLDLSVNKINLVQHQFPELNGEGMLVSVKEQQFDFNDIDLRNRNVISGFENEEIADHSTQMATIIGGAGNSSELGKGVVPKVNFSSTSFENLFPDEESYYGQNNILVQNHSYGIESEQMYSLEAEAYDRFANHNPTVLHIFSSGNQGQEIGEGGIYNGIPSFATLTGGFKMAKNVLVVGALDRFEDVPQISSRGPAYDGRVKPELVAYAGAGSSDAAAITTGVATMLQQAYFKKHSEYPSSALIKSLLITGADDVMNEGVDFESGFGAVNATSSLNVLQQGQYIEANLDDAGSFEFELEIPENTTEFRMSLTWIDPPALVNDAFALMYDLDARLIELSTGKEIEPWILSPFPSVDSLKKTAVRGDDVLNNIELITLSSPAPGNYKIQVTAKSEAAFGHAFSISYDFEEAESFRFTFPTSSDVIKTRESYFPRWESTLNSSLGVLEMSINRNEWQTIEEVDLNSHVYQWQALDSVVTAQFRMEVSGKSFESDEFRIIREARIQSGFNCDEEVLLFWNRQDSAVSYKLFSLGDRFMELVTESSDTSVIINKSNFDNSLFAVQPVFENGSGARGSAYNYELLGSNCYFIDFFGFIEEDTSVRLQLNLGTTFNIRKVSFTRNSGDGLTVLLEFPDPDSLELIFNDEVFPDGTSIYSSIIELEDGSIIETNSVEVFRPSAEFITIYPNPAPSGFPVNVVTRGESLTIQILNQNGEVITSGDLETIDDQIELPILSQGVYFYRTLSSETGQVHEGRLFVY
ncbi:MAG: S8 family peptidase [Bacteroidota bacterium]